MTVKVENSINYAQTKVEKQRQRWKRSSSSRRKEENKDAILYRLEINLIRMLLQETNLHAIVEMSCLHLCETYILVLCVVPLNS